MRPRALAVALGLPIPRMQPSESVAGEMTAFLREHGVEWRGPSQRWREDVVIVGGAPELPPITTSTWLATPREPIYVAIPATDVQPKSIEMAPELDVWRKNDGGVG